MAISTKEFMKLGKRIGALVSEDAAKGLGGGESMSQEMTTEDFIDEILKRYEGN